MPGVPPPDHSPLFSLALQGFLLFKRSDGRSPATINGYRWALSMMLNFLGDPPLDAIGPEGLRRFFVYLQSEYKPKYVERLSNHSLDSFWIATRAFFSWGAAEYGITRPDLGILRPRYTTPAVHGFTEEEVRAMLKACEKTAPAATEKRAPLPRSEGPPSATRR